MGFIEDIREIVGNLLLILVGKKSLQTCLEPRFCLQAESSCL